MNELSSLSRFDPVRNVSYRRHYQASENLLARLPRLSSMWTIFVVIEGATAIHIGRFVINL
jgi:hypothetical protein